MRTLRYGILPYGFILVLIAVLMYEPHLPAPCSFSASARR